MGYSLHYYDLVSLCIAASLGLGAGIGYATSIAGLGVVAIGFIVHALFVNGPVDEPEELTDEVDLEEVPQVLSPVDSPE